MPTRGFPPSSRSNACANTVFPAPVSPVRAFSPGPSRSSARSIRSRFSTRSSTSIRSVVPAAPDGMRARSARQRAELVHELVVEAGAGELCQHGGVVVEAHLEVLTGLERAHALAVGLDVDPLLLRQVADHEHVAGGRDKRP